MVVLLLASLGATKDSYHCQGRAQMVELELGLFSWVFGWWVDRLQCDLISWLVVWVFGWLGVWLVGEMGRPLSYSPFTPMCLIKSVTWVLVCRSKSNLAGEQ